MKTKSRIVIGLLVFLCCFQSLLSTRAFADNKTSNKEIIDAIRKIAVYWTAVPTPIDKVQEEYDRLMKISASVEGDMADSLLIYQAMYLVLLRSMNDAEAIITQGLKREMDIPEFLERKANVIGSDRADIEARREVWDELGRIVPLSLYGSDRDYRRGRRYGKINPPPPRVPRTTEPENMIRIGELFEEMGFVRLAINTYVEVLYMSGTSLDDNGGKLWLRVADLELRCGEKKLALRAYLKAAYRSDNARAHAEKGLRTSLGKEQQKDIPPAKFDVEKIKEIANIYGQLNMHPLGLSFLRRAGKTLDVDLSEEEKRLASDWAQILQQIAAVAGNDCSVYGHDISKVDDWATVKILRPSDTFWKPSDKEASNKEANGSQE